MVQQTTNELRVLVRRESESWVAVCLEHFFATQAWTLEDVKESFRQAYLAALLHAHQAGQAPFENLEPAPAGFVEEYDRAEHHGVTVKRAPLVFQMDGFEAFEVRDPRPPVRIQKPRESGWTRVHSVASSTL